MWPIGCLREDATEELRKCINRAYKPESMDKEIVVAAIEIMRNRSKAQSEIFDDPIYMDRTIDALESTVKALAHIEGLRGQVWP